MCLQATRLLQTGCGSEPSSNTHCLQRQEEVGLSSSSRCSPNHTCKRSFADHKITASLCYSEP